LSFFPKQKYLTLTYSIKCAKLLLSRKEEWEILNRILALWRELSWWCFYHPLFVSGKIVKVEVIAFGKKSIYIYSVKTLLWRLRINYIFTAEKNETILERQLTSFGVPISFCNCDTLTLAQLRKIHQALRYYEPGKVIQISI